MQTIFFCGAFAERGSRILNEEMRTDIFIKKKRRYYIRRDKEYYRYAGTKVRRQLS